MEIAPESNCVLGVWLKPRKLWTVKDSFKDSFMMNHQHLPSSYGIIEKETS